MDRHFDVPVGPAHTLESVRIRSFDVEPYPDVCRLKCTLVLTDSSVSPDAEMVIEDHEGYAVTSSSIIGLANSTAMFTMHIREPTQARSYTAKVSLTYEDERLVDPKVVAFSIPHPSTDAGE